MSVDSTTVLVKYTDYGDANLSGTVNALDFNRLASNYNTSGKYWADGERHSFNRNARGALPLGSAAAL